MSMGVYWEEDHFSERVLLYVALRWAKERQGAVSLALRVCGQVGP